MNSNTQTKGVVLFNLGGPDSLSAVEPFLYNLFNDPDIIDIPFGKVFRPLLAKLISSLRAKHKTIEIYKLIGGKSPLKEITLKQAEDLEKELSKYGKYKVFVAMRYWHPFTEEVVEKIKSESIKELILLPLYPQYSNTTTGSSFREWKKISEKMNLKYDNIKVIKSFYNNELYLNSLEEQIKESLRNFSNEDIYFLFSAHGVPVKVIQNGDPYQKETESTVELVMSRFRNYKYSLAYQSKVGPTKWLEPSTMDTIKKLGSEGIKNLLVIPISFVSDHSETLYEIEILLRGIAEESGIKNYAMMKGLNDSSTFIKALADIVLENG